jgi:[CysO sulfur-carrier protein]-S-L-cysteine hydrolase
MDEANARRLAFFVMHQVRIRRYVLDQMIEHAQSEFPLECCGLLSGQHEVISDLHTMRNHVKSTVRFEMDPLELFKFFRRLRAAGDTHLGIYHSHPSSEAYPSATDIQESFYPDCSYFIISLKNPQAPQIRAFQIEDEKVRGVEISELE